ncbi:MAG TPA: triose-phosphate isomerase [Veillonellaceae bacterium]|jgi:triosephosphate isomerase|nr:triose-phosphate isomerase [Veillonellaceae bacterium]
MRKPLIAGNWKMNKTAREARPLLESLAGAPEGNAELLVCPPFTDLTLAADILKGSPVQWGAQNMYGEKEGAFTGEISPLMLKELGCSYVICGHSERRMIFGESNEMIRRKTEAAFWYDMIPILCVGETAEQRKAGQAEMMIARQLKGALQGLIEEEAGRMVIAYEPVWAIGSGEAASPEEAGQICTRIRAEVAQMLGHDAASSMRILYGGSVSPANIRPLMDQPDIDGALVGGASLEAGRFLDIYRQVI